MSLLNRIDKDEVLYNTSHRISILKHAANALNNYLIPSDFYSNPSVARSRKSDFEIQNDNVRKHIEVIELEITNLTQFIKNETKRNNVKPDPPLNEIQQYELSVKSGLRNLLYQEKIMESNLASIFKSLEENLCADEDCKTSNKTTSQLEAEINKAEMALEKFKQHIDSISEASGITRESLSLHTSKEDENFQSLLKKESANKLAEASTHSLSFIKQDLTISRASDLQETIHADIRHIHLHSDVPELDLADIPKQVTHLFLPWIFTGILKNSLRRPNHTLQEIHFGNAFNQFVSNKCTCKKSRKHGNLDECEFVWPLSLRRLSIDGTFVPERIYSLPPGLVSLKLGSKFINLLPGWKLNSGLKECEFTFSLYNQLQPNYFPDGIIKIVAEDYPIGYNFPDSATDIQVRSSSSSSSLMPSLIDKNGMKCYCHCLDWILTKKD